MSKLILTEQKPGYYYVSGELTYTNINKKTVNSLKWTRDSEKICIDLANVTATDSAGLALMIEWIKLGQKQKIKIAFKHIPEQLLALAKLSGLDENEHFSNPDN